MRKNKCYNQFMNQFAKNELLVKINEFEEKKFELSSSDAELTLYDILVPLLNSEGFSVRKMEGRNDGGVDFVALKEDKKIGIQYKHYRSNVGADTVRGLIGAALVNEFDKVILLTSSNFTKSAHETAAQIDPIAIELMDISSLKKWSAKIEANYDESEVTQVLNIFTRSIIELIAKSPRTLDKLEWRDIERVLAEIFHGLGFKTILTPPSKDGGKDIIVECLSEGTNNTFIIEIKHWRSRQKVGEKSVKDFLKVITKEKRVAGLFLSTYGYTENVVESITEIERQKVKLGEENKILSLCKTYMKRKSGIWQDDNSDLAKILFSETI